jgi:hypothetical protein
MNTIEDRLRAATRAAADTVAPDSAPPLRLPRRPARRLSFPGRRLWRNWPAATAPLAAAAAVVAVVAASVVITGGMHGSPAGTRGHHPGTRTSTGQKVSPVVRLSVLNPAGRAALASVPPYYVALTGFTGERRQAVVRATATGAVLATVIAPRPYNTFSFVTGAADDRTFVLAAQQWWPIASGPSGAAAQKRDTYTPTRFFLLRLGPADGKVSLTALSVPPEPGSAWIDGIALSPDGSKLAVAHDRIAPETDPGIEVFALATGSEQSWVWSGAGWIGNFKPTGSPLSWTADGRTLAFQLNQANGVVAVRLLDTAAPGHSLRSSTLAVEWANGGVAGARGVVIAGTSAAAPASSLGGYNTLITPDGSKIVCVTADAKGPLGVTEFSASIGRMLSARDPQAQDVLWTNAMARMLIVATATEAGVLTGNQFTPIPGTSRINPSVAW